MLGYVDDIVAVVHLYEVHCSTRLFPRLCAHCVRF